MVGEVGEWIRIATLCEVTGSLPSCGGLFDQTPGTIWRLEKIYQARNKYQSDELEKNGTKR